MLLCTLEMSPWSLEVCSEISRRLFAFMAENFVIERGNLHGYGELFIATLFMTVVK